MEEKIYGGENMGVGEKNVVDFVREIAKKEKLEPIVVRVIAEPYLEENETGILDILDFIWVYGQSTGGFILNVEQGVPEFVTIVDGFTPNEFSRYYYNRSETLVTDGQTIFISKMTDSDGHSKHDVYRKYKVINATFVMIVRYEKNNFNGENESIEVYYYGDPNSKLVNVLRRLNDLLSP
jgi:hypothetical protein